MNADELDAAALKHVALCPGAALGELCRDTGERRAAVVVCLRRLRRRGLVEARTVLRSTDHGVRVAVGYFPTTTTD